MESNKPPENLQMRFKEKPESIKVGDKLEYKIDGEDKYFINQFGFKVDTILEGTRIKTAGFSLGFMSGASMLESEGVIFHKNGQTFLTAKTKCPTKFTL